MRGTILLYAVFALAGLGLLDDIWPVWPIHVLVLLAGAVILTLAGLALVAAGRRR